MDAAASTPKNGSESSAIKSEPADTKPAVVASAGPTGTDSADGAPKTEPSEAIDLSAKPKSSDDDAAADGGAAAAEGNEVCTISLSNGMLFRLVFYVH